MIESHGMMGTFEITVKQNGKVIQKDIVKNRIMNVALNESVKPLTGVAADLEIKYLAVGTSNTALADNQTQLVAESVRFEPSVSSSITGTGEVSTEFTILDTEAQVLIEELGIFCGSTATATANTGIMLSRILWTYDKTVSNVEISVRRTDKAVRV